MDKGDAGYQPDEPTLPRHLLLPAVAKEPSGFGPHSKTATALPPVLISSKIIYGSFFCSLKSSINVVAKVPRRSNSLVHM